ncbi:hypothetical protein [Hydrogenibacillus sp. N12]|uniref:hypothetical protein n=1 Tax=Hydrogenibacillus sp. N12 TaxID=2866627 RepID=UPI001C7CB61C|nr:hypothetical protein [Hydrogenibacillus sp. N12]QZA34062.1 hypothetical protein K2M58_06125 [Hydrogenibacillus sp. N12]
MRDRSDARAALGAAAHLGLAFLFVPVAEGELYRAAAVAGGSLADWVSWSLYRPLGLLLVFGIGAYAGYAVGRGLSLGGALLLAGGVRRRWATGAGRGGPKGAGGFLVLLAAGTALWLWLAYRPLAPAAVWGAVAVGGLSGLRFEKRLGPPLRTSGGRLRRRP